MQYVIIFLVVAVVFFLIGRELLCWYFKINESLAVQIEIRDLLKGNNNSTTPEAELKKTAPSKKGDTSENRPTSNVTYSQKEYR